jgi:hypothetical protein
LEHRLLRAAGGIFGGFDHMKSFVTVALGVSFVLWGQTGSAATQTFLQIAGEAAGAQTNVGRIDDDFRELRSGRSLADLDASGSALAPGDTAFGSSFGEASVDPVTGSLAFRLGADGEGIPQFPGGGTAFGEVLISQSFDLQGTGTFTALMSVDVSWSAPIFIFAAQTAIRDGNNGAGTLQFGQGDSPNSGSISDALLTSSFENFGLTQQITVQWRMSGFVGAGSAAAFGSGLLDASNTGLIFFTTDGTLTATPTIAGFLSNPAFLDDPEPAPVPLPASVGLLSLALASLWIGRRRPRLV